MALSDVVNTFGQMMLERYGERVHKLSINAGFTCPNRDGSKGIGGCTFCNNVSFSPNAREQPDVVRQIGEGRAVIAKRTRAKKFMAYFQAYTNTYADVGHLDQIYREALSEPDVVGLSIGTRPDCVPPPVLDLLAGYQDEGYDIWLELGLQSAFDTSLERVNRGHTYDEYVSAVAAAQTRDLRLCTHLILGLPGEDESHWRETLDRVLELGTEGLKIHPLHVVKGTQLANEWRRGEYEPLTMDRYICTTADLIERTPTEVVFHRITGTAALDVLLTPAWCNKKWAVLNGIESELKRRGSHQGRYAPSINKIAL